jgi:hypothetical protein
MNLYVRRLTPHMNQLSYCIALKMDMPIGDCRNLSVPCIEDGGERKASRGPRNGGIGKATFYCAQ